MANNVGSIYAEAELNIDQFTSAAGGLEAAAVGIAAAMAECAAQLSEVQTGADGALAGTQRVEQPVEIAPVIQSVAPLDSAGFEAASAALPPVVADVPAAVRLTVESVAPIDAAVLSASMAAGAQGMSIDVPVAVNLQPEADLSGLTASLTAAGASAAQGFASGIASGAGATSASASAMASGALNAARSGVSGAQSIGSMISAGVASGIRSGQSGVVSAAVAMVSAAVAAAKAAAQIHSPSRITTEFGKFWDEGWAVGIEKNTGIATAAAANMVTDTIKAVDSFGGALTPDLAGALRSTLRVEPPAGVAYGAAQQAAPALRVTGSAIDYDALADAMNQRQVALYMNDRRMARVMATETARAQGARSRSIALGYGK